MTISIARGDAAYLVKIIRGCNLPSLAGSRREALKSLHVVRQRCTIAAQALRLQREAQLSSTDNFNASEAPVDLPRPRF